MLAQKLVLSYSTKIVVQIIQMATSLVVARIVGPSVLGTIAYGLAFVSMFSFLADLGIGSAHIKLLNSGFSEKDSIGTFATLKIILVIFYTLTVLTVIFVQKYIMNIDYDSNDQRIVIFIYLAITSISFLFTIPSTTWAAKTEQAKQDIPTFIQTLLFQLFKLAAVLIGLKAIGISLSNLLSVLLVIPIYFYLFKNYKFGNFNFDLAKSYVKISIPIILIGIFQVLIFQIDKVILEYYTNITEVGYYSAAFTLGSFIKQIEGSVGLLFFPLFSGYILEKNIDKINSTINKFENFTFTFVFPIALVLSLFPHIVVKITYGTKFDNSIPIISVLILSFLVSLSIIPYGNILFGNGKFFLTAIIWFAGFLIFCVSSFFFTSGFVFSFGGVGIAISLLITNISIGVLYLIFSRREYLSLKILPARKKMISISIYSLIFYFFVVPKINNIFSGLLIIFVYLLVYWLLGYALRILKKDDFLLLKELINFKKMKDYIKKEIK